MNLTQQLVRGRALLEEAIRTSGTKVRLSRDGDELEVAVDLDTLEVTEPTPATLATGIPALIVAMGPQEQELGPNRSEHPPTHNVWLPVSIVDIEEGDVLTVETAKMDPRIRGAELRVTAVLDDGIGVGRHLHARRD